ncbi:eCIS core domain-containing protein [Leptothoe spongobia]|uniref:DUF4157 domain-containing protein n=1 Tax=Leptothoe spongobia TAU-MAC 1115 TaxID=1967444 RepID=A0A947DC74_9CYAN|nr:DUF4157 domain-containing protein [Leptothoe spongobia]MBT9314392.1 DUF4157 domain-containing protein [Leptothoe spongobia TAU-MAC 1115]
MRTFAQKQKPAQKAKSESSVRPSRTFAGQSREVSSIFQLQRTIENPAVQRSLHDNGEEREDNSLTSTWPHFAHDFSRITLHANAYTNMQPKLRVNVQGDKYEQEANRIAEQVMRMPDVNIGSIYPDKDGIQRKCTACESGDTPCPKCAVKQGEKTQLEPLVSQVTPLVQQQTMPEELEEDKEEKTQAKETPGNTPDITPQTATKIGALRDGGQPLSAATRRFFEPRFGTDFSGVRVHTGQRAMEIAKEINARAFTLRNNVFFGAGQYVPESSAGKKLLAHELTHVVQQGEIQAKSISKPVGPIVNSLQRQPSSPGEAEFTWSEKTRKGVRNQINLQLAVFNSNFGDAAVEVKVKSAIDELKEKQSIGLELLFEVAEGFLTAGLSKLIIHGIKKGYALLAKRSIRIAEHYVKLSEDTDSAGKLLQVYAGISNPALNQAKSFIKSQFSSIGSNKAAEAFIDNLRLGANQYTLNISGQVPSLNDDKLKSLLFALQPENIQIGRFREEIDQLAQEFKKYVSEIGDWKRRKPGYYADPYKFSEKAIWVKGIKNRKVLAYVKTNRKGSHLPYEQRPKTGGGGLRGEGFPIGYDPIYYRFKGWIPPSVADLAIATTKDYFGSIETVPVDEVRNLSLGDIYHLKSADDPYYDAWIKGSD